MLCSRPGSTGLMGMIDKSPAFCRCCRSVDLTTYGGSVHWINILMMEEAAKLSPSTVRCANAMNEFSDWSARLDNHDTTVTLNHLCPTSYALLTRLILLHWDHQWESLFSDAWESNVPLFAYHACQVRWRSIDSTICRDWGTGHRWEWICAELVTRDGCACEAGPRKQKNFNQILSASRQFWCRDGYLSGVHWMKWVSCSVRWLPCLDFELLIVFSSVVM